MPALRKYPAELRERAIALALSSDRPLAHIAEELGIHREALRTWVRRAQADRGERPGLTADERQQLRELQKESVSCAAPTRSSRRRARLRPGARPGPAAVMTF